MSAHHLELGESRFLLELVPDCADLLPDVFPGAVEAGEDAAPPRHRVSVTGGGADFEVRWSSAEDGLVETRRLQSAEAAMLVLQEAVERWVIAEASKFMALHGGAVSTRAGACLILGNSGSGKSSTTFQLLELGARFLCEEITLCDPESWRVHPYLQTLSLSTPLFDEFEAALDAGLALRGRRRDMPPVVRYRPPTLPAASAPGPAVGRILLPRYRAGDPTRVEPVPPEEALTEVLGYCFPPNVDAEAQFDRMIALVERAEILRFVYPSAGEARSALAELFDL